MKRPTFIQKEKKNNIKHLKKLLKNLPKDAEMEAILQETKSVEEQYWEAERIHSLIKQIKCDLAKAVSLLEIK